MTCPIAFETLVAYWAGDLDPAESDAVEEHFFGCAACTREAERVVAVTECIRHTIPPIVTRAGIEALRARGVRVEDNVVVAGTPSHVTFTGAQDVIIHHLSGLALGDAARVDVAVRVHGTGELLLARPDAPFERATGEVLVACQRHFAAFPPDIDFFVTAVKNDGTQHETRYFVSHAFV